MTKLIDVPRGLAGVAVADTALSDVRGEEGFFHYRQYDATELARLRSYDDVWHLLLDGTLPTDAEAQAFAAEVAAAAALPPAVAAALPAVASAGTATDATRTAVSLLGASLGLQPLLDLAPRARRDGAVALGAVMPALVGGVHRARLGLPLLSPPARGGTAHRLLHHLHGADPDPRACWALERYLVLVADHGFNASTFTARVIASTGADLAACVVGAIGALSGPLHGGAPSRVLDMLDDIGTAERAEAWIEARLAAGQRLMGFGHAVYRGADPRSDALRDVARTLGGPRVDLAVAVETAALRALTARHPERPLGTNVELYAAVVMEGCGVPRDLFTSVFALARTAGWCAAALEQAADGKLIRPSARYVGPPAPAPVPCA